ncbi:cobyrinate a,c-diamide synthase [Priestia endophytica]|uniref:Cobyrinate a,c-diamide synthase n=1 Tax=Priestia endophytica DSM 13796 TaxID=1121089 RepID=A0A1I5WS12_9BACI|nr:cobyrinate a,c-diamide synthase [Priestia endophytica]KYG36268.1 cobyrinic acid a,c-diamide synthase [Priestia endophytica]MBG9815205.1 cobyrinic acid a,c-diamide synthase [Priestia endophytica]SFQ22529.1 cobyrinic acid a,c-diamide synthase [Priestia endophytica DSM 13796]
MVQRRLVVAGTGSGVGKTTLTIGLMSAFKKKGYTVQGFKCGPDYIDPTYHTAVTRRVSRNIDSWMLPHDTVKEIVKRNSEDADISIIEGVMGFYDGKSPLDNRGTTAEISVLTNSPVLLVVNCASMARSAAAIVKGFQMMWEEPNIVSVIANNVGSEGHYKLVKKAIEQECGIPVVGYVKRNESLSIPERHLGLVPSIERGELHSYFNELGDLISETVNLEALYKLAETEVLDVENPKLLAKDPVVKIAVARDKAFNFYYEENLELLKANGAEIIEFSPLNGESVPSNVQGLYIGGGFPEEFANELSSQEKVKESFKDAISSGMPTLAECGGFMFLADSIETTSGEIHKMVGVVPGRVKMQKKRAALGYREIKGSEGNYLLDGGLEAKGHEFHYSTFEGDEEFTPAYETKGMRGVKKEGYMKGNLLAGYTHFHFGSCPQVVKKWIAKCEGYKG